MKCITTIPQKGSISSELTSVAVMVVDGLLPDPVVCAGDCKLTAKSGGSRNVRVIDHPVDDNVEEPDKVSAH